MSHITPDTFAAITSQVLMGEFTAYTATKPGYDVIAMSDTENWQGSELIEYATYNATTNSVEIRAGQVWYQADTDDTDTVSRALANACKRIESALTALLAA